MPMTMNKTAYGGLSVEGNAVATTIVTQNVYVQFTAFDTDAPSSDAVPANASDDVTVNTAGDYLVSWSASASGAANDVIAIHLEKNNGATDLPGTLGTRKISAAGDVGRMANSTICTLAVADTVELWAANESDTSDFTLEDVSMSIVRVG